MKLIKTANYKKANTSDGYDPYRCDFNAEAQKSSQWDDDQLAYAFMDATEASKGANGGKYTDQLSVYHTEAKNRGWSRNQILAAQAAGKFHPIN